MLDFAAQSIEFPHVSCHFWNRRQKESINIEAAAELEFKANFYLFIFFLLYAREKRLEKSKKCVYNNCDLFSAIAFSKASNEV